MTWFYSTAVFFIRIFMAIVHPLRIHNKEAIRTIEGPAIVCCNHISWLDALVLVCCTRRQVRFMAKKELFEKKFIAKMLTALGAFPVDRGASDTTAIRTAINVVKEGGVLGIFPEGTRHYDQQKHPIEAGVSSIALRTKATLVPAFIQGPYKVFRASHITFGDPISFADHEGRIDRAAIDGATQRISEGIWSLQDTAIAAK